MKKKIAIILSLILFPIVASALNLNRAQYVGIGKIDGAPLDFWTTLEFDDEDGEVNIGNVYKFLAAYNKSESAGNINVTLTVPGNKKCVLKSTDGGESFQGVMPLNKTINLWLLKVPSKLKVADGTSEDLYQTVSSPDGYTSFVQLRKGGGVFSVTSEFLFAEDNYFSIICDTPSLQEIFTNIRGTYSVEDDKLILKLVTGNTLTGTIYNDGNYITIPVGSKDGMEMTIILIR